MTLFCRGATLDKGFLELAPPSSATPHPFILYDVTQEDWHWFLYTVKISASLSPLNRVAAGAVPMAMGLGLFGWYSRTSAYTPITKTTLAVQGRPCLQ